MTAGGSIVVTSTGALTGSVLTVGATSPALPVAGDVWFDTSVNAWKEYSGSAWAAQTIAQLATTGASGYALINGTGVVTGLSWTAPADGLMHRVTVFGSKFVSSAETGGAIGLVYKDPGGNSNTTSMWAGTQGGGVQTATAKMVVCQSGQVVTVSQTSALTGGASVLYAELWGS